MPHIELPQALEDYFAHAETARTRSGRRFTITLPYMAGERLDRLQWWWQMNSVQEQLGGDAGLRAAREQAIARFRKHIEQWLLSTRQRLYGNDPFPQLGPVEEIAPAALVEEIDSTNVLPWPTEKVVNG